MNQTTSAGRSNRRNPSEITTSWGMSISSYGGEGSQFAQVVPGSRGVHATPDDRSVPIMGSREHRTNNIGRSITYRDIIRKKTPSR